jgi:hypothetical protein
MDEVTNVEGVSRLPRNAIELLRVAVKCRLPYARIHNNDVYGVDLVGKAGFLLSTHTYHFGQDRWVLLNPSNPPEND